MRRTPERTEATETMLRRAPHTIGDQVDELAAAAPSPATAVARSRIRRRMGTAAVLAAGAAAATIAVAVSVRAPHTATSPSAGGDQGQTLPQWIACSRTILEGDVTAVSHPDSRTVAVTFDVTDWIKPADGPKQTTVTTVDPALAQVYPEFSPGQHLLVVVPVRSDLDADTFSGSQLTDTRAAVIRALPAAAHTACPPYWRSERSPAP